MFQPHKKLTNKEILIGVDEFSFDKIKIFVDKKFVLRIEEEEECIENLILFQTVAD